MLALRVGARRHPCSPPASARPPPSPADRLDAPGACVRVRPSQKQLCVSWDGHVSPHSRGQLSARLCSLRPVAILGGRFRAAGCGGLGRGPFTSAQAAWVSRVCGFLVFRQAGKFFSQYVFRCFLPSHLSGTPGPRGTVCLLVVGPPRSFSLKTSRFCFGDFLSPGSCPVLPRAVSCQPHVVAGYVPSQALGAFSHLRVCI